MCEYCKNVNKDVTELKKGECAIIQWMRAKFIGEAQSTLVPFNYCPNCGEKIQSVVERNR